MAVKKTDNECNSNIKSLVIDTNHHVIRLHQEQKKKTYHQVHILHKYLYLRFGLYNFDSNSTETKRKKFRGPPQVKITVLEFTIIFHFNNKHIKHYYRRLKWISFFSSIIFIH